MPVKCPLCYTCLLPTDHIFSLFVFVRAVCCILYVAAALFLAATEVLSSKYEAAPVIYIYYY